MTGGGYDPRRLSARWAASLNPASVTADPAASDRLLKASAVTEMIRAVFAYIDQISIMGGSFMLDAILGRLIPHYGQPEVPNHPRPAKDDH